MSMDYDGGRQTSGDEPTIGDALIAHPDAKMRQTLRMILKKRRLQAHEAPTASRAMRLVQSKNFRVALVGRDFPGEEGGELVQEIVRLRPLLPMVVISPTRSVDAAIFAKRIGAISVNTPIDENEVGHVIRRLLEATGAASKDNADGLSLPLKNVAEYRFIRALGPGGNRSMVLMAQAPMRLSVDRVAVKIMMRDELPADSADEYLQGFLDEARAMSSLAIPGLVPILDFGYDSDQNVAYIVYPFIDGFSLGHHYATSRLPLARKLETLAEICRILTPLHAAGLVHGNLRPTSILIDTAGSMLLTNYGEGMRSTRDLTVESARYVSPEVVAGAPLDGRSDLFSLGAVGYRLICNVPAFDGASPPAILAAVAIMHPAHPRHHVPNLPSSCGAVLKRMLKKAPAERYQSAGEARDALREAAYLAESASDSARSGNDSTIPGGGSTWFSIPKDI